MDGSATGQLGALSLVSERKSSNDNNNNKVIIVRIRVDGDGINSDCDRYRNTARLIMITNKAALNQWQTSQFIQACRPIIVTDRFIE